MKTLLRTATLALLMVLVALAQAPRRQASWLDPDKSEPAGTHYATFSSRLAGGEVSYLISLPPTAGNWPNASATSRVLQRGDVEVLTFETEQDYDRLQELYARARRPSPRPAS